MSVRHPRLPTILASLMIFCVLAMLLASSPVWPAPSVLTLDQQSEYALTPHVEFLEDPSGELTLRDVTSPSQVTQFRPVPRDREINFGYSHSTYWLRFTVTATPGAPALWWLEIGYFSLEHIWLYGPDTIPMETGLTRPFSERPVAHRFFILPIKADQQPRTYYLKVRSAGSLTIPLRLWQPAAFTADTAAGYSIMSLYFGALIALLLYNLLLYLSLRDHSYLLYVLFAASMGCAQLAWTGIGNQYLWTGWDRWNIAASDFAFSATGFFAIWFVRSFLDTHQFSLHIDRALRVLQIIYALNMIFLAVHYWPMDAAPTGLAAKILSINTLPASFLCTAAGVVGLQHRRGGARYFLAAWTALLIGSLIAALRNFGWVPTNVLTAHMLQIGSALEMLLLSFALADRIHTERRAREQAQAEALQAHQAMVDTLAENETMLEQRICQRTRQLAEANERLRNSERRLRQAAHTDPLTGLANRLLLDERLSHALETAARSGRSVALLLIDLDRFKPVNDRYGHGAGDEVLREVARRLLALGRASDTVARFGGDEFVMVLEQLHDADSANRIAGEIVTALAAPVHVGEQSLSVGASVGVALYPEDARTAKMLRQSADLAMYAAKQAGGNGVRLYRDLEKSRLPATE